MLNRWKKTKSVHIGISELYEKLYLLTDSIVFYRANSMHDTFRRIYSGPSTIVKLWQEKLTDWLCRA